MTLSQQCEVVIFELGEIAQPVPRNESVEDALRRWDREKRILRWGEEIVAVLPDFARCIGQLHLPRLSKEALDEGRLELTDQPWAL